MNQHVPPSSTDIQAALGLTASARRTGLLKRAILIAAGGALALALVGYAFQGSQQATVSYETAPAVTADLVVTVTATGTIEPITQVDVGSELSGIVSEVLIQDNDPVKTGQVLARLDTRRLSAQHASAKAKVKMAEAGVAQALAGAQQQKLNLDRQKSLGIKGIAPKEQVDAAVADSARASAALDSARAQLAAAQADLSVIETDLGNAEIVAPIDGVVLKRSVEPGQTVASSLQAPVLFQIAQDLKKMQLEAKVDEADMGAVKEGQDASFSVDAYRGRSFPATLERLSYAPETVDGVVTYTATLSASNEALELRPGMTATARITTESYQQVLTVPNEALRYRPPKEEASNGFSITSLFLPRFPRNNRGKREASADGLRSLYVLRNGAAVEIKVKTGASDGKSTLIREGDIKAGDELILSQKVSAQ